MIGWEAARTTKTMLNMADYSIPGPVVNLLPFDGFADYYGKVLSAADAKRYLDQMLNNITWRNDEAVIFGRHIITKRKVAWYGNKNYSYAYSGKVREALAWTPGLLELKAIVEGVCGRTFNSCLLNLYHTGEEGMALARAMTMKNPRARWGDRFFKPRRRTKILFSPSDDTRDAVDPIGSGQFACHARVYTDALDACVAEDCKGTAATG